MKFNYQDSVTRHCLTETVLENTDAEHQPDLVISLSTYINRVLYESLRLECPEASQVPKTWKL